MSDLLENLPTDQIEDVEHELKLLHLKILYLKSKFRQFGAKINFSSDLFENMCTSQFESAEYEFDWF